MQVVDSRLVWAQRLAVAGLAIMSVYHVDEVLKATGASGFLPIPNPMLRGALFGVPALALSASAFALSLGRPSIIVSLVLLVTGILMTVDAVAIGIRYFSVLTVPGPVIGFFYGLAVLSMGIIKTMTTATVMRTPPATKN